MRRNFAWLQLLVWSIIFSVAGSALAQQPVDVSVKVKGDILYLEAITPAAEPALRMNPSPKYLELAFPASALKKRAFSKAIDKGLIQKVVTSEKDGKVFARVYVVSKPKSSLKKTEKGYLYTLKLQEMATTPARTAAKPKTTRPAAATRPVATRPVRANPNPTPARTVPSVPKQKRAITITLKNAPLATAVEQMAKKVGLASSVDPNLKGVVTRNFKNVPFDQALATVLKPYGSKAKTSFSQTGVKVAAVAPKPAATAQPPATTAPAPPVTASQPTASGLVREYFPFKKKSATKAMNAAQLAFPDLSYQVDPLLNVLLVEGTAAQIQELEKFLRAQSPK